MKITKRERDIMTIDYTILLPIIILQVIFSIYCFVIIAKNTAKLIPKWAWRVLCISTLGCVAFLIFGRKEE